MGCRYVVEGSDVDGPGCELGPYEKSPWSGWPTAATGIGDAMRGRQGKRKGKEGEGLLYTSCMVQEVSLVGVEGTGRLGRPAATSELATRDRRVAVDHPQTSRLVALSQIPAVENGVGRGIQAWDVRRSKVLGEFKARYKKRKRTEQRGYRKARVNN